MPKLSGKAIRKLNKKTLELKNQKLSFNLQSFKIPISRLKKTKRRTVIRKTKNKELKAPSPPFELTLSIFLIMVVRAATLIRSKKT